jgi:hypothetical protein
MSYTSENEQRAKDKAIEARNILIETAEAMERLADEKQNDWKTDYLDKLRTDAIEIRKMAIEVRKIEQRL